MPGSRDFGFSRPHAPMPTIPDDPTFIRAPNLLSYEREIVAHFVSQHRREDRQRILAELRAKRESSGSLLYVLEFLLTA